MRISDWSSDVCSSDLRVVRAHQLDDERCDIFGQIVREGGVVGNVDLLNTRDAGGVLGHRTDARTGNKQLNFAELRCGGDHREPGILDGLAATFGPKQKFPVNTSPPYVPRRLSTPRPLPLTGSTTQRPIK